MYPINWKDYALAGTLGKSIPPTAIELQSLTANEVDALNALIEARLHATKEIEELFDQAAWRAANPT